MVGTPERRNKILHVSLRFGHQELTGSDSPPEYYEEQKSPNKTILSRNAEL